MNLSLDVGHILFDLLKLVGFLLHFNDFVILISQRNVFFVVVETMTIHCNSL